MSLFKKRSCCCGECEASAEKKTTTSEGAAVKILGGGCAKCNQLEANTIEALKALGMDTEVDHVKDYGQIAAYGVMTTPALVYNGKVLCYGKVYSTEDIIEMIKKA